MRRKPAGSGYSHELGHVEPIKRTALCDSVVERLRQMIAARQLKIGDRLPPERELAQILQVSRVSVREALKVMSVLGLVEIRPWEGVFVGGQVSRFFAEPLVQVVLMEEADLESLLEARQTIEVRAAELAALRASEADLESMRNALSVMEHLQDAAAFGKADVEFHLMIASACRNQIYVKLIESIRERLQDVLRELSLMPGVVDRARSDHARIYEAIAKRDPISAANSVRVHLALSQDNILKRFISLKAGKGECSGGETSEGSSN